MSNRAESGRLSNLITGSEARAISTSAAGVPIRYDQAWLTSVLRPLLIAVMVACIDIVVLSFVARVAPFLSRAYIPLMVTISVGAVVIGCVTTTWLAQPEQRHRRTAGYRLAELGLLLVLTRLAVWLLAGDWPSLSVLLIHPLVTLFDGLFVVNAVVVALSWIMATTTTEDLLAMALRPDELYAIEADRIGELVRTSYSDRPAILRAFVTRWMAGGIILVIFAAGLGVNFTSGRNFFTMNQANVGPAVIFSIILYFLSGLVLISHGQLAILRSRWTIERIPSAPAVLRNWPLYVVSLLLIMGLIAALLPFGDTFRLAQILGAAIGFVIDLFIAFFRLIAMLFLMLISLFTGEPPPQEEAPPPPPPPAAMPEVPPQVNNMPEWAGGAVFWVAMALLLGYAAYIYFSGKGFTFGWLNSLWLMLVARWRRLRGAYDVWIKTRLPSRQEEDAAGAGAGRIPLSRWRLGNLNDAQRVRYFYLTTLERAEQSGLPRHGHETPRQYAPRLTQQVEPTLEDPEAVQALTEAFVRVRYGKAQFDRAEVNRLQQLWQQLRKHLHR